MARKYGELSAPPESAAKSWAWASVSGTFTSSDGRRQKKREGSAHVDGEASASVQILRTRSSRRGEGTQYDQLVVDEEPPATPGLRVERTQLYNAKTGKWTRGKDLLIGKQKDPEGHGDTIYPRLPQVFQDPAHTLADALLHAKTAEETKLILDQIAIDLRPGSFQASMVDFEASIGLVLTDEYHGVMIELIEAGSSASDAEGISTGDYVLEVNGTDVTVRSADQVETMLLGKEHTTVSLIVQVGDLLFVFFCYICPCRVSIHLHA